MSKPEVFGVIWIDLMLGPLSLRKSSAEEALEASARIRSKADGKVEQVHAVHVEEDSDCLIYLD